MIRCLLAGTAAAGLLLTSAVAAEAAPPHAQAPLQAHAIPRYNKEMKGYVMPDLAVVSVDRFGRMKEIQPAPVEPPTAVAIKDKFEPGTAVSVSALAMPKEGEDAPVPVPVERVAPNDLLNNAP